MVSYTEFKPESTPVIYYSPWPRINTRPGGRRYLLWPVYAYKVLAPRPVERKLNIFQKAVLGICRAGQLEPDPIANRLHLDREVVRFVLSELRRSGFLNQDNTLTTIGETTLVAEMDRLSDEIISAYIFQDPWQARLWPRVAQKLEFAQVEFQGDNPYPNLIFGSKGEPKRYSPFVKRVDADVMPRTPSPAEILRASRRHERDKRLGLAAGLEDELIENTSEEADYYPLSVENPVLRQIEIISEEPELYYITTTLYIPAYEQVVPDWYVWDPLGLCASPWLRRWMDQQAARDSHLKEYLKRFLVECLGENLSTSDDRQMLVALAREAIRDRLGELAELYPFYDWLMAMERTYQETRIIMGIPPQDMLQDVIIKGGKVLEGLFRHIHDQFSGQEAWRIYNLPDRTSRGAVLDEIARDMGYDTPLPYSLSGLTPDGIRRSAESGGGTLGERTVATLLAAHREMNHPLRRASKEVPDLFLRLTELMRLRGQSAHETNLEISPETISEQREIIYRIINQLATREIETREVAHG